MLLEIERLDPGLEQPYLMLADCPEPIRRQVLLGVEREDGCRSVVRGWVIGRAGKRRCAGAVRHMARADMLEGCKLREPAGQDRPHATVRGHTQEGVSLSELAVLVAAAGHERVLNSHRLEVERDDVEMVIGIDEQCGPVGAARVGYAIEPRYDLR